MVAAVKSAKRPRATTLKKPKLDELMIMAASKFTWAVLSSYDRIKKEPHTVARYYIGLRAVLERLDEAVKMASDLQAKLKNEILPQLFEDEKISTVVLSDLGMRVTVSELLRVSVGEDKDKAKQWLRDHGLGELIIETVNAGTLASAAREMMAEGKELDPDLFKSTIMKTTSVTKVK